MRKTFILLEASHRENYLFGPRFEASNISNDKLAKE